MGDDLAEGGSTIALQAPPGAGSPPLLGGQLNEPVPEVVSARRQACLNEVRPGGLSCGVSLGRVAIEADSAGLSPLYSPSSRERFVAARTGHRSGWLEGWLEIALAAAAAAAGRCHATGAAAVAMVAAAVATVAASVAKVAAVGALVGASVGALVGASVSSQ